MSSGKSNSDGGRGGRGRRNEGDDDFRNYMHRKIELQRKQFGLVLPPPPPPSPPPQEKLPTPPTPKILKRGKLSKTSSEEGKTAATPASEKKTVRFHHTLENGGVSRVLKNLKQQHARRGRSSSIYRRRRKSQIDPTLDSIVLANPDLSRFVDRRPSNARSDSVPVGGEENNSTNSCTSILGVLGNLQKRHGTSSPKRKRPSSVLSASKKRTRNHEVSALPLPLGSVEENGPVASVTSRKDDNDVMNDNTTPARRRGNSLKCMGSSTLDGFESTHDGSSRQDEFDKRFPANKPSILNDSNKLKRRVHHEEQHRSKDKSPDPYGLFGSPTENHSHSSSSQQDEFDKRFPANNPSILNDSNESKSQVHHEEQHRSRDKSPDPYGLFGSPTEEHSPAGESVPPPAKDSQEGLFDSPSENHSPVAESVSPPAEDSQDGSFGSPTEAHSPVGESVSPPAKDSQDGLFGSPTENHSPVGESVSTPAKDSQDGSFGSPTENHSLVEESVSPPAKDSQDGLFDSPTENRSPVGEPVSASAKDSQDGLFGSPTENHSPVGESVPLPAKDSHDGHRAGSCATIPRPLIQTATASSLAASTLTKRPDLFFIGIVVLVNGHTSPDSTTLMRLLHKHGGDLEKYETRRVTHIIASQLSAAKANIYKRQKKPTPVCRPEWITESVERGKLLPFADYLLEDVKDAAAARSVKSFFNREPHLPSNRSSSPSPKESDNEGPLEMEKDSSTNESSHHRWQDTHPSKANYHVGQQVRTVGNDPNFLDSYFANSRLSYIGSFKQRAKPNKSSSRSRSKVGAKKFVLLVDMDCFFASVALRKHPEHKNKPVAVGHAHSSKSSSKNSSSELSTCNYIAREHGIKKGMFLGDAIQLCPALVVLPYDFKGFEEVSGIVADLLHAYAERYIGCIEQVSCDESYVEINLMPDDCPGNDIYDFVNTLAENIRADILHKTDCTASIGIGPNKLLAKLAADRVKPNACCVVKDGREFLDGLNLRDIPGIGRKFQMKLQTLGLCTVNDVWYLADDAEKVLGNAIGLGTAHKIVQYCHGKDDRAVTPAVQKSIGAECNYGVRFDGPYGVDHMMRGLAKEVQKRMNGAGVRGAKLTVKIMVSKDPSKVPGKFLGHGKCDSISRSGDIPLTRDKDAISSAALKLYGRLGIDKKSVRGMGIVIGSLISDEEADPLNSSPSKLSAWLKKDTAPINDVEEVFEGSDTSNKVIFTLDDDDASDARATENTNSDNAMIPTFSQLDQDVLHSLPDDILSEVKSMYGKNSSHATQSTNESCLKAPGKVTMSDKQIPIAGQTSVRRMLKLACVKSGEARLNQDGVSLSQLECLPLEVQLQIANGDDIEIAKRPKQKTKYMNDSRLDCTSDDEVVIVQNQHIESQEQGIPDSSSPNFYQENIAPLQNFISLNPNPDSDAVDSVKCFLSLCIEEKRINDAVILLRAIKNMQNGWDNNIYLHLRESTVREIFSSSGSQLDIKWLGL